MNYLILCLDACRYDSFKQAVTPNFDKLGDLEKAYSASAFTAPALLSFLTNMPLYNTDSNKFIPGYPRLSSWLPTELKAEGYYNAFITSNPLPLSLSWAYSRDFNEFGNIKYNYRYAADKIIDRTIELFKTKKKLFIFALFMATHRPYCNGEEILPPKQQSSQIKAVEAVDREVGRLLPYLNDVTVRVCSDHGELFGEEGRYQHGPSAAVYHRKLFEIPLIRSTLK